MYAGDGVCGRLIQIHFSSAWILFVGSRLGNVAGSLLLGMVRTVL